MESRSQADTGQALPAACLGQEGGDFTATAAGARGSGRTPVACLLAPGAASLWLGEKGPQIPRRAPAGSLLDFTAWL